MKKLTSRTLICLILALMLAVGTGVFVVRWFTQGGAWVSFSANDHLYRNGVLKQGTILDRNGVVLAQATENGWVFHENSSIRRATLHATGDAEGKIGAGATNAFADRLSGYNFLTGARTFFQGGRRLYLTIDADLNLAAYEAMGSLKGCIGLYDYTTGAILCMVSAPGYDPASPPEISEDDVTMNGAYINRFLSASFIPGSTFKLITSAAALETLDGIQDRTFTCTGSLQLDDFTITCPSPHGDIGLGEALTVSCNCVFAQLAVEMGPDIMETYVKQTGLTNSYSVNGIPTKESTFNFRSGNAGELGWSGVGQGFDLVNPCAMMVYAGAIANGGKTAKPQLIAHTNTKDDLRISIYLPHQTSRLLAQDTADTLKQMMKDNVTNNYGTGNFPGLTVGAKSGTAQDGTGRNNAWFVGFVEDVEHPLAFVVFLEGGGSGSSAAGSVASRLLQAAIEAGY